MADEIPAPRPPRLEPISIVWHTFAAPQTLLVLMAVLALTLAATGLIPQSWLDGLNASESWLTVGRGPLSRYTDLARSLGLFDLYHSLWFRLLMSLVALALVVRAVDATELAWRAGRRHEWRILSDLPWVHRAQQVDLSVSLAHDRAWQVAVDLVEEDGYDWTGVQDDGRSELVALYRRRRFWLCPLVYAALFVAGAGLFVTVAWGWQGEAWQPLPLEIHAVGHDSADAVRLDAFDLRLSTQGQLVDYQSRVTWLRDGAELRSDVAGVGQPARLDRVALRQISYAPVVRLRAETDDGRPLFLQMPGQASQGREVVTVRFASLDEQPLVFLPQRERFFSLAFEQPGCASGLPAVHIYEIEQSGQQSTLAATLLDSGQVKLGNLVLGVELIYVPVLRLDYRPGANVAFAALGVAWMVLIALWLLPGRLFSLTVVSRGDTTHFEIKALPGPRSTRYLSLLSARLAEAADIDD